LWAFVVFRSFRIVVGILAVLVVGLIMVVRQHSPLPPDYKPDVVSEQEQQEACRKWKESYDRGDDDAPPRDCASVLRTPQQEFWAMTRR
jgi:hypothetical protein